MHRLTTIVADPHPAITQAVTRFVGPRCELLDVVSDGEALVAAALRWRPELVVSGILMPGLDGLEAARRIRDAGLNPRLVFFTAETDTAYARQAIALGCSGYVVKHAAPEELVRAIEAAATGGVFVSPEVSRQLGADARLRPASDHRPPDAPRV